MYILMSREDVIRIPPERLGEDIDKVTKGITQSTFEGRVVSDRGYILLTTDIERVGEGRIVHGDSGVYQKVKFNALVFKPELQEVIQGTTCEVLKFGAFVRLGPLDGLLHISQILDDRIDIDDQGQRLTGKDTKKDLRVGDKVKARIVAVSLNERSPRESKIGLTMRQFGLGKLQWLEDDRTKGKKEERVSAEKKVEKEKKPKEK